MRLIPVIDLKQGQVVRGVAGNREAYRPIVSSLCVDASPVAAGRAFRNLGFDEAYVADLDAIAGADPDWRTYESLLDCGLRLLVDAGVATRNRAETMAAFDHDNRRLGAIVVGLESVGDCAELRATVDLLTPQRTVFSLDLRDGRPVTRLSRWQTISPESIADEVLALGIRRLIVLDMARVGIDGGVGTLRLCQSLRQAHDDLEIISGGGVRHVDDLHQMARAGCDAALVASALHDGRLSPADLGRFRG
jgi:phosphoribosylformimino-5-aminoimidazole carboxamide ribotide isomerase